jgi:hypothetical protein
VGCSYEAKPFFAADIAAPGMRGRLSGFALSDRTIGPGCEGAQGPGFIVNIDWIHAPSNIPHV